VIVTSENGSRLFSLWTGGAILLPGHSHQSSTKKSASAQPGQTHDDPGKVHA
jgi:hypothetical protein